MSPTRAKARPKTRSKLATYRAKRDFSKTAEPKGSDGSKPPRKTGNRFVVQRHRARRLHYDFRLELDGVLVSWAVPKGPTLDPKARRMAVHVEDHPIEYFDFEGVIPKGEYGGGDVIVWDWGTWQPAETDDPGKAISKGDLHFDLDGEKLKGRFALVRSKPGSDGKQQWLMIHKHDDFAVTGWDADDRPKSVKSGRTNDEVAAEPDDEWTRDRPTVAKWARHPKWKAPTAGELDALEALGKKGKWRLGDHEINVTNLDKVLFPADGKRPEATKRDLIRYHACIAPFMLPYLVDRPVNARRFPDGVTKAGFWKKARPSYAPDFVRAWRYEEAEKGETEWYAIVDNPAALAWMANFGAVELNPWTSREDDVHMPTWALIDLDPGTGTSFDDLLVLARLFHTALDHLGMAACPKVTGKRGIQIWVPIADGYTFDETRAWVESLSRAVGSTVPDLVSWAWQKKERKGRARLDYTQNAINKTLVAPFSTRPAPGAPVSVPIRWDELDDPNLSPDRWTIRTVLDRLGDTGDPLNDLIGLQQRLPSL